MVESSAATADYKDLKYQVGFGNHFATECLPDTLPKA